MCKNGIPLYILTKYKLHINSLKKIYNNGIAQQLTPSPRSAHPRGAFFIHAAPPLLVCIPTNLQADNPVPHKALQVLLP